MKGRRSWLGFSLGSSHLLGLGSPRAAGVRQLVWACCKVIPTLFVERLGLVTRNAGDDTGLGIFQLIFAGLRGCRNFSVAISADVVVLGIMLDIGGLFPY